MNLLELLGQHTLFVESCLAKTGFHSAIHLIYRVWVKIAGIFLRRVHFSIVNSADNFVSNDIAQRIDCWFCINHLDQSFLPYNIQFVKVLIRNTPYFQNNPAVRSVICKWQSYIQCNYWHYIYTYLLEKSIWLVRSKLTFLSII